MVKMAAVVEMGSELAVVGACARFTFSFVYQAADKHQH